MVAAGAVLELAGVEVDVELEIVTVAVEVMMIVVLTGKGVAEGAGVLEPVPEMPLLLEPPACRPTVLATIWPSEHIIPAATCWKMMA